MKAKQQKEYRLVQVPTTTWRQVKQVGLTDDMKMNEVMASAMNFYIANRPSNNGGE